jgi:uncharacterized Zn-binding protein involved in type VI secretion
MYGIARIDQDTAGGTILGALQDFVTVEGTLWSVLGDPVQGHDDAPHDAPVMAQGSPFVRIQGIPACRAGHLATCGHPATGSVSMRISE